MKKSAFAIKSNETGSFKLVNGYLTDDGKHGLDKRNGTYETNKQFWYLTDIPTGLGYGSAYKTRKEALEDLEKLEKMLEEKGVRETKKYKDGVKELKKWFKENAPEEDKKMSKKTTKTAKAMKKDSVAYAEYKKAITENAVLKAENADLKARLEALEPTGIDAFNVEEYLATRDNENRITPELVKAFEQTKNLNVEMRGEWLYITGDAESDTRDRKDIFKALGFRFSGRDKAWYLAPYPLRNSKSYAKRKFERATA